METEILNTAKHARIVVRLHSLCILHRVGGGGGGRGVRGYFLKEQKFLSHRPPHSIQIFLITLPPTQSLRGKEGSKI